eukprot:351814-Chlamydomonas_euryale.AAC.3
MLMLLPPTMLTSSHPAPCLAAQRERCIHGFKTNMLRPLRFQSWYYPLSAFGWPDDSGGLVGLMCLVVVSVWSAFGGLVGLMCLKLLGSFHVPSVVFNRLLGSQSPAVCDGRAHGGQWWPNGGSGYRPALKGSRHGPFKGLHEGSGHPLG